MAAPRVDLDELKEGDILIQTMWGHVKDKLMFMPTAKAYQELMGSAYHGMFYIKSSDSNENKDSKKSGFILHSAFGKKVMGVKPNKLADLIAEEKITHTGQMPILRCKDPLLQPLLVKVIKNWNKDIRSILKLTPEAFNDLIKKKGPVDSFIPFSHYNSRLKDAKETKQLFALYRAFRDHKRNHAIPVQSLSKKKGTSCGNFVVSSIKVAMIDLIFPAAILQEINKQLERIEQIKLTTGIKKLSDIKDQTPFLIIQRLVEDFKKIKFENKENLATKEDYINFLYFPIKGRALEKFCLYAFANPNLFEIPGYLFFKDEPTIENAAIITHEQLQAVSRLTENPTVPPEMTISSDHLAKAKGIVPG